MLCGKRFSLRLKGKVNRSCVQSAMLNKTETWCPNDRSCYLKRALFRAMRIVKLMYRNNTSELMTVLGLTVLMKKAAKANAPRWFGHLRAEKDNLVRMVLNFEVRGKRKSKRLKSTFKEKVKDS